MSETGEPFATIRPAGPFAFEPVLRYFARNALEPVETVHGSAYLRAFFLDGEPAAVRVWWDDGALRVAAAGVTTARAAAVVTAMLQANRDSTPFEEMAARDPVLAPVAARSAGVRPPLPPDPFDTLVWAVLGQQISLPFAYRLKRRLAERYGRAVPSPWGALRAFPTAGDLVTASPDELRAMQISGPKARYLIACSEAELAGAIPWQAARCAPLDEAVAALCSLQGVGRWTAEYVLLRGLGRWDAIPAGDAGLRHAIGAAYLGRRATEAELREVVLAGKGWAPYAGLAAFRWWLQPLLARPQSPPD